MINVIECDIPFKIDKEWIREDLNAPYNKIKKDWFFKFFSKGETDKMSRLFYDYLNKIETNIYFFDWLPIYLEEQNIYYHFENSINPITKLETN